MIIVPIEKVEREARRDGLETPLRVVQQLALTNGYNPLTGAITIRPYKSRFQCALRLSHELKHQIDLQHWPAWLAIGAYWPPILGLGLWVGMSSSWLLVLPAVVVAYLLHPFEVSANVYALNNWRRYFRHLESR